MQPPAQVPVVTKPEPVVITELNTSSSGGTQIKRLDPNQKSGSPELLVLTIKAKNIIIEATIREDTKLDHLSEMISLIADFKSYPKKFKEIF